MKKSKTSSKKLHRNSGPPEEELSWDSPEPTETSWSSMGENQPLARTLKRFSTLKAQKAEVSESGLPKALRPRKSELIAKASNPSPERKGRRGKKTFNVLLEYDPSRISGVSSLLMESVASRGTIPADFDMEKAIHYHRLFSNHTAHTVTVSEDIWHLFIFATEYVRLHGTVEQRREIGMSLQKEVNPDFDVSLPQPKQDGTYWGQVDDEPAVPVRTQIEDRKKVLIDRTRSDAVPAAAHVSEQAQNDVHLSKWIAAEKKARMPRPSWEGKLDYEFECMVKYCYGWLREAQYDNFPKTPLGDTDLFWHRPRPDDLKMNEKVVARRNYMTAKVMRYWYKAVASRDKEVNINSSSYRVVLAAQALSKAIEVYAKGWKKTDEEEAAMAKAVKKAAHAYFKAHIPAEYDGGKPGPVDTLDPSYPDYIRLCRKYGLSEGTILHLVDW